MANIKACLVQDPRSLKNYDLTPLIAPIRHNRFLSLFEVEEILQQGQQQRLDVGSLQEYLGFKKHRFVETSLDRPALFSCL